MDAAIRTATTARRTRVAAHRGWATTDSNVSLGETTTPIIRLTSPRGGAVVVAAAIDEAMDLPFEGERSGAPMRRTKNDSNARLASAGDVYSVPIMKNP